MAALRKAVVTGAMVLSLSGCLTTMGVVVGGVHASSKNSEIEVQQGYKPRTSVGKWMAIGGVIGLVLDVGLVAIAVSQDSGGHFGH